MDIVCSELLMRLGDDELLVIDCRHPEDWSRLEVHIPGALRISVTELSDCAHVLPDDELIVLCGVAPDGADSRRAHRLLKLRGRDSVCLSGGLQAWLSAGYPTERPSRTALPARHPLAANGPP